jgi:hypothetical protein
MCELNVAKFGNFQMANYYHLFTNNIDNIAAKGLIRMPIKKPLIAERLSVGPLGIEPSTY